MEKRNNQSQSAVGSMVVFIFAFAAIFLGFMAWNRFVEEPGMRDAAKETEQPVIPTPKPVKAQLSWSEASRNAVPKTSTTKPAQPPARRVLPPPPPVRARAFPVADDIPIGMEKSKLVAGFGKPSMITTAVNDGTPTETWIYMQRNPEIQTVVFLRDGRVVKANSTIY
jgi:hypothetical protein